MAETALITAFPGAAITYDNAAFFEGLAARRLVAPRCRSCSRWHLPPQPLCPTCWSTDLEHLAVAGAGVIYMFTEVTTQAGRRVLATVSLDEQDDLRFSAALPDVDASLALIGRRVSLAWRATATAYEPVFALLDGEGG